MYYWVVAWGREGTKMQGKRALYGPFNTETSAQDYADALIGHTDIHKFPTRNEAKATRFLKEKGVSAHPDKWEHQLERVSHKKD